jgi:5'-3' exonuclease
MFLVGKNENVVIYGLDADLSMLSIFHFEYFKNGYIFREAPEFLKSSIKITDSKETEHYVIDIEILRQSNFLHFVRVLILIPKIQMVNHYYILLLVEIN